MVDLKKQRTMKLSNSKYGFLLNLPGLLLVLLWVFLPALIVFLASFFRYDNVRPVVFNGVGNYQHLFRDRLFWVGMENIATFCIGTTVLTSSGGDGAGFDPERHRSGGRSFPPPPPGQGTATWKLPYTLAPEPYQGLVCRRTYCAVSA
jgi:hypothetical protein